MAGPESAKETERGRSRDKAKGRAREMSVSTVKFLHPVVFADDERGGGVITKGDARPLLGSDITALFHWPPLFSTQTRCHAEWN